jgi:hypothetical protein
MTQNSQSSSQRRRRREMDLMGTLIVVGLVFFYSAQIFSGSDFYVERTRNKAGRQVLQLIFYLALPICGACR